MLLSVKAFTFDRIFLNRFLVKTSTEGLRVEHFFKELSESPKMLISSMEGNILAND